jgi:hypothetical protein
MPSLQSPRPAAFAVVQTVGCPDLESATRRHQRSEGLVRGAPPKACQSTVRSSALVVGFGSGLELAQSPEYPAKWIRSGWLPL